ncbi:hypothetical protein HDV05_004195, partial [Chytridiales sp. JEL 0842]
MPPKSRTLIQSVADINLTSLQKELDLQGLEIVDNQKESLQSRKKLADQTKEFKKVPDEQKLTEFKVLLKAYQTEIDSITKRCKTAETSFLNLYKHLAEAPDPTPIIQTVQDQLKVSADLAASELENKKLKEELQEIEKEAAELRSSEGSVATLKQRLTKYEAKLDEMVNEKVLAKENEMRQAMDEKIRIYKETEYSLQRQLNQVKDQLISLQSTYDVSQAKLVDNSFKYDEEVALKLGEMEIVMNDLERTTQKNAQLERDNELLKRELAGLKGEAVSPTKTEWQDPATLSRKVKAQDAEISKLLEELDKCKSSLSEKEVTSSRRQNELEREIAVKALEIAQLSEKLSSMDDYEQVKKELTVMKQIEFANPEEWIDGWGMESTGNTEVDYSLEKLLMEKNKRLQGEVTALKLEVSEAQENVEDLKSKLGALEVHSESQARLISKLEEDMSNLVSSTGGAAGGAVVKGVGGMVGAMGNVGAGQEGGDMDPLLMLNPTIPFTIPSVATTQATQAAAAIAASSGTPLGPPLVTPQTPVRGAASGATGKEGSSGVGGHGDASIVPILASQRDRYRHRNAELEEQHRKDLATISDLQTSLDSLKADNVHLFEKLKYAESFKPNPSKPDASYAVSIPSQSTTPQIRSTSSSQKDDLTSRYSALYTSTHLNPFHHFQSTQKQSHLTSLPPTDRAALLLTKLLTGN